jgi:hypothetical protein
MTKRADHVIVAPALMLALLCGALALPALAANQINPFINLAWYLSFYGLPILVPLLIILIAIKSIRDFKRKRAALEASLAAGAGGETAAQATEGTAEAAGANPEPAAPLADGGTGEKETAEKLSAEKETAENESKKESSSPE